MKVGPFTTDEMLRAYEEQAREEFGDRHIPQFMSDLANCGSNPATWLCANNISGAWEDFPVDVPEMIQAQCLTWISGIEHPGGAKFWQVVKRMAVERFEFERSN